MLVGNKAVRELFRTQRVASTLLCFVLDEGHCVSQWASFRQHYKNLGDLHYTIPGNIPFYIASATLPSNMLDEIIDTLNLKEAAPTKILYSNDRPEISLSVKVMVNKANSYHDLDFLIPNDFSDRSLMPRKFLVFFDNTTETREAILHLRKRMPLARQYEIKWFNSTLTMEGRKEILDEFRVSKVWGLCCTDAFGMVR